MTQRNYAIQSEQGSLERIFEYSAKPINVLIAANSTSCSVDEMAAVIDKGAHKSATEPLAAAVCRKEALERVKDGCCRVVKWNDIKDNPPANLKISPIAAIPHKSRLFRMILDLSFILQINGKPLSSVNDTSDKSLAPQRLEPGVSRGLRQNSRDVKVKEI